ncbi:MAG: 4Fe-4S dicluster domain-containing protein [Desulfosarcina sp.]|nr:4Fe-4S dicluster domain-containing protein [Desulfosarcina sp.]MBC2742321.1 4Fe-4S dicluster domain-containing protein [Desulfosarcina sp.]MBC2765232.1 4Fe-4S ferredoxin [Desulfosarcina sp.]
MGSKTEALAKQFEKVFDDLELVIGWETGFDSLHATPAFIRQPSALGRLIWNPFCSHNLSGYLTKTLNATAQEDAKKIGICVKGCDSRSVVALIQEKFISRERLYIAGIPCRGTVDLRRLMRLKPSLKDVNTVHIEGNELAVETARQTHRFPLQDVLLRKCLQCRYPNPVLYDELIGEPLTPRVTEGQAPPFVDKLEAHSLEQRRVFWERELDRCIRCYACRNACPLCVCQDNCILESRMPKWLSQRSGMSEKFFFHMIHAVHLAGRCTECGECERVCPMEIPVALMKEKLNQVVKELLDYEAGLNPETQPPLLTFDPSETGI